jgi:phosphoglycolate phosphatase
VDETRAFVGDGVGEMLQRAAGNQMDEQQQKECLALFAAYYTEHQADTTKPYDGIEDLFRELKRRGCKIGVVSNKTDLNVKMLCESFFPDTVDMAIGETAGVRRKPEPDEIFAAMKALGSRAEETVMGGDSVTDVCSAAAAGVLGVAATWGYQERSVLEEAGAKIFIDKPEELLDVLL